MDINKIGRFIKELRLEKNISQNQLSEEIHVTRQAISNWENGKAIPDSDILLTLSSLFKVSINEILSGERNTSESNLQDITLQLIDENNDKRRKIKRILLTSTISIISLFLIFLGFYFINNYNSIKVYSVNGKSTSFKTYNGIFVTTRNKFYLRLGKIRSRGQNNIDRVNKVKLFYLNKDNRKVVILENDKTDILLDEDFGYKEYFYSNNLNTILNNMYLEITYNEKEKEIIKLNFKEKFKNNFLFKKFEKQKVLKDEIKPESILKKDAEMQELLSREKLKVDELMKTRKLLDSKKDEEIEKEPVEKIVYISNYPQEYEPPEEEKEIKEEMEPKEEVKISLENTIQEPDNNNEEEQEETISLENLIQKIKEKGTFMFGGYSYELIKEDKLYSICYDGYIITIDIVQGNSFESIQIYADKQDYNYQKFENNSEIKVENGTVCDSELINKIINDIYNL